MSPDASTVALLAQHPRDIDPHALQENLMRSTLALGEMDRYEAALAEPDADCGLASLAGYDSTPGLAPAYFPGIRAAVEEALTARRSRAGLTVEAIQFHAEVPSAVREAARCEAFRADPGRYLPGATRSTIRMIRRHQPMDGFVEYLGVTTPWMYCPMGVGDIAIADASYFIRTSDGAFDAVILVSTHVKEGVAIPTGYMRFAEVR